MLLDSASTLRKRIDIAWTSFSLFCSLADSEREHPCNIDARVDLQTKSKDLKEQIRTRSEFATVLAFVMPEKLHLMEFMRRPVADNSEL